MTYHSLWYRVSQIGNTAKEQGVIKRDIAFSPHLMRRTYATVLYKSGMGLKAIQEKTMHVNIEVLAKIKPILIKQKVFTNIVSLWNFNGQFVEITQNTKGNYTVYLMSKQEAEEWENDDGSEAEDMGGRKIGTPPDVIVSESLQLRRKKR